MRCSPAAPSASSTRGSFFWFREALLSAIAIIRTRVSVSEWNIVGIESAARLGLRIDYPPLVPPPVRYNLGNH